MTHDEYAKTTHETPYLFVIRSGSKVLYYFGERHSFNPDDKQWITVKDFWRKFCAETADTKRIAFMEGGLRKGNDYEKKSIMDEGGMGLLAHLAHKEGIAIHSPEPDDVYERNELEKQFLRKEIQLYYFARVVHQWCRKLEPRPDFKKYICQYLERDKKSSKWDDFDFSLESIIRNYEEIFNRPFDKNDKDFLYSVVNPVELRTVINRVSRHSSEIRDEYMVKEIVKYISEGYSVFGQFGASHGVRQEPLLKELLENPSA